MYAVSRRVRFANDAAGGKMQADSNVDTEKTAILRL